MFAREGLEAGQIAGAAGGAPLEPVLFLETLEEKLRWESHDACPTRVSGLNDLGT